MPPNSTGGDALPRVAVLLLNWNGWRDTIECLESLFRLDYPRDRLTVVLCDNASTDGSVEMVRRWASGGGVALAGVEGAEGVPAPLRALSDPPVAKPIAFVEYDRVQAERGGDPAVRAPLVIIHTGDNLGFAGGNNVGLRYLQGRRDCDQVWILNNDIVVAPDSLRLLAVELAARPAVGALGATLMEYREPEVVQIAGGGVFSPARGGQVVRDASQPLDYVAGGCLLAPVDVIRKVGPIAEEYFLYGEDVDYSFRIRQAGYQLAAVAGARGWHKGGVAIGNRSPQHDYYILRNNLYLIRKYRPASMPVAIAFMTYRFVLPKLVRRQWTRLAYLRRAWSDFRRGVMGRAPDLSRGA